MSLKLPSFVPGQLNRPAANQINALETKMQDLTISGYNELVPVVYGEQLVSGYVLVRPTEHGNNLIYAIAVSYVGVHGIERYMSTIVNGVKEDAPAITANPAVFSRGGVSIRLYDGKQTAPDATLRAALGSAYQDVFEGVSYAVISIPNSQSTTFDPANAVKFVVRGKKCFDPRTGLVAWTENPSLHLADYVYVSENMGSFKNIIGTEECADWNDSLYSGLPRARSGIVINEVLKVEQILGLFCSYAESLWSYDGETIRIIPDKPIEGSAEVIAESDIKGGTLTFTAEDLAQMPTAVSVFFSDRESEDWGSLPGYAQSPQHEIYGSAATKSDVQMPGVYRRVQAERMAWQRLMRLQTPGRIGWQMYDVGIKYQAGDVLRLPNIHGLLDLDVRLMSQPELIAPGIYQMHAEIYSNDHYPTGGEGAVVPDGALILFASNSTPSGFEVAYSGEDIPVVGGTTAGVLNDVNAPSGSITGRLLPAGDHFRPMDTPSPDYVTTSNGQPPINGYIGSSGSGNHEHSVSFSLSDYRGIYQRKMQTLRLLKKVGASGSVLVPTGAVFFAVDVKSVEGVTRATYDNRILLLGNSVKATNERTRSGGGVSTSGGFHHHEGPGRTAWPIYSSSYPVTTLYGLYGTGLHNHSVSGGEIEYQKLKRKGLLAYRVTSDKALLPKGAIIAFGAGAIPDGWALCNGSNGTPNLTDYFIEAVEAGRSGNVLESENKIKILGFDSSSSSDGKHKHPTAENTGRYKKMTYDSAHSGDEYDHSHSVSSSVPFAEFNYIPKRYSLRFIQYKGE